MKLTGVLEGGLPQENKTAREGDQVLEWFVAEAALSPWREARKERWGAGDSISCIYRGDKADDADPKNVA
jgi:hypothetical protein